MALITTSCEIVSVALQGNPGGSATQITITWSVTGGPSFTSSDTLANVGNYVVGATHTLTVT